MMMIIIIIVISKFYMCVISLTFGQILMVLPLNYNDLKGFTLSSSFPLWLLSHYGLFASGAYGTSGTKVILELGCNPKTKMP